jgi:hypothetical protein
MVLNWKVAFCAVLFLLALTACAFSAEPRLPAGYTCTDIRENVKKYGYWPALLWAKANGFTPEQIAEAKRCLQK